MLSVSSFFSCGNWNPYAFLKAGTLRGIPFKVIWMMLKYYIGQMSLHQEKCCQKRWFLFKRKVFFTLSAPFSILLAFMYDSKIYRLISYHTVKAEYQILAYTVCIQPQFCRGVLHNINRTNMLIFNQFIWNRQLV